MESSMKSRKRRSLHGNCQNLFTSSKSLRHSITDRLKYKYKSFEDEGNKTYHPDSLNLITQHNWSLYRVSNLWNVKYTTVKLKQYAARIRNELIKNIKDTVNDVTFSTKIEVFPELEESDDSSSLKIEVYYKKDDNKPVLKYRGVILSGGNNNSSNIYTQLPLLLCIGAKNITKIVHNTLYSLFDSLIRPLRISEDDLMWMSAMLSDFDSNRKKLVNYDFLLHSSEKSTLTVTLDCTPIKDLWNHIHPAEAEEISYQEVQNFHKHLQNQLEITYGIKFKLLKLKKIEMCDATITCEGKVKIHSENATYKILSFINDVSLILDSANSNMSGEVTNNTL